MLINFTVGNFKAFKDKVTLDMRAASFSKIGDSHVIDAGRLKLLKSAAIFGPNASGKSKLLDAMKFMRDFVINSSKNTQANEEIEVDPFRLNTETREQPSFFEIEFLTEETSYRYGFEVNRESVLSEWLFFKPNNVAEKPLFVRRGNEIEIVPGKFKEGKGIEAKTRNNSLFLSAVAQWNGEISMKLVAWFDKLVIITGNYISDNDEISNTVEYLQDGEFKKFAETALKLTSLAIEGVEIDDDEKKSNAIIDFFQTITNIMPYSHINTLHNIFDKKGNAIGIEKFSLSAQESRGTEKFFHVLGTIYQALKEGEILICDELDTSLHPLMMKAVLQLFTSKVANDNGAQFIFTTHDTNLIDTDFLSRDQIWFLEKDRYGASRLYSLAEFKTRKDVNHEREYFMGRYGAIPFIENLENAFIKPENGQKIIPQTA